MIISEVAFTGFHSSLRPLPITQAREKASVVGTSGGSTAARPQFHAQQLLLLRVCVIGQQVPVMSVIWLALNWKK